MSPSMYGGAVRDGVIPAYPVLGPTVIQLRGEHDLSSVASLSETIARTMSIVDVDVVIELSDVTYLSSATIHLILRARDGLEQHARSLTLRSPSPIAHRILEVCELDDLIEPTPEDNSKRQAANVAERSCGRAGP